MKPRTIIVFGAWAQLAFLCCSIGAAVCGLFYGAAALAEGLRSGVASELED